MSDPRAELQSTLRDLFISEKGPVQDIQRPTNIKNSAFKPSSSTSKPRKSTKKPVADSWEDEADLSSDDNAEPVPDPAADSASTAALSPAVSMEGPLDPPPTPLSPQTSQPWGGQVISPTVAARQQRDTSRRPEKQTAVAGRLIAGALGIRAPKRTEEQRVYDRAIKEQEIKRRNREREELAKMKEAEEQAKVSVWTD